MSPVEWKKWPCRPVDFRGLDPSYSLFPPEVARRAYLHGRDRSVAMSNFQNVFISGIGGVQ